MTASGAVCGQQGQGRPDNVLLQWTTTRYEAHQLIKDNCLLPPPPHNSQVNLDNQTRPLLIIQAMINIPTTWKYKLLQNGRVLAIVLSFYKLSWLRVLRPAFCCLSQTHVEVHSYSRNETSNINLSIPFIHCPGQRSFKVRCEHGYWLGSAVCWVVV